MRPGDVASTAPDRATVRADAARSEPRSSSFASYLDGARQSARAAAPVAPVRSALSLEESPLARWLKNGATIADAHAQRTAPPADEPTLSDRAAPTSMAASPEPTAARSPARAPERDPPAAPPSRPARPAPTAAGPAPAARGRPAPTRPRHAVDVATAAGPSEASGPAPTNPGAAAASGQRSTHGPAASRASRATAEVAAPRAPQRAGATSASHRSSIETGRPATARRDAVGPVGRGAAIAPTSAPRSAALALASYPRPTGDNGRGIHWIPTVKSAPEVVDRFVDEAGQMHARWVVLLNDGTNVGANDYLVRRLVDKGIEPVMRIYTPGVQPLAGDIEGMVTHYRALGVHYFQLFNEPNLRLENGGRLPDVDRYLDAWIPAARRVASAGGLPGFGALAPGGDVDDLQFLRQALDGLKARGALDTLDRAWLSMHNYTGNRPVGATDDSNGFLKFRWYDDIVRQAIGRSLPIVGTEGGTFVGNQTDPTRPAIDLAGVRSSIVEAMRYVAGPHEPYLFANSLWVIANGEGGGHDPTWERHALIRADGPSPVVGALRALR